MVESNSLVGSLKYEWPAIPALLAFGASVLRVATESNTAYRAVYVVASAALLAFILLFFVPLPERVKRRRLEGRPSLSNDDFYARDFAGSGVPRESVLRERDELARVLGLPADKLRGSDRIDVEYAYLPGRGDEGLDELSERVRERCSAAGVQLDVACIRTLKDYVIAMARVPPL